MTALYTIKRDGQGSGGFLCPPGHPNHEYVLKGYYGGRVKRDADLYASIELALDPAEDIPESVREHARRIMSEANLVCSVAWVKSVYGYFRNSYSLDGADRNVSHAVIFRPGCRHVERHRPCKAGPDDGVHTGANVPGWHKWDPAIIPPAEHHLGYLCVKSYFPEHTPILDLIESGSPRGYGSYPCLKCDQRVQYEARYDAHVVYPRGVECPKGGRHEIAAEGPAK